MNKRYLPKSTVNINFIAKEEPSEFDDLKNFGTIMEYDGIRDKTFWERIGVGGTITANPIAYKDIIYFGAYDKNFYALGLDGRERWRFPTNGVIQAHALCLNGRVFFGSKDKNLYCLDADTGEVVWKLKLEGPLSNGPSEHRGVIYMASEDGKLYAIRASDGSVLWIFKTSYPITTPLIKDERIYTGYESCSLYCLSLNGEVLWRFNAKAWISAWPPASDNETIYFGSADKNLYAVSTDGKLKWRYAAKGTVLCPVAEGGRIYFGCTDDKAYCLDSDGRKIWEFKAESAISEIEIDRDIVYMGSYDNHLYTVDKNSGELVWKFKTNGFVHCKPLVYKDRVVFGSWDCNLYCLDKKTGELVWRFRTSLSSPSIIEPPEQVRFKRVEFTLMHDSSKKSEEKYRPEDSKGYDVDVTTYANGMSKTYVSSRKTYINT